MTSLKSTILKGCAVFFCCFIRGGGEYMHRDDKTRKNKDGFSLLSSQICEKEKSASAHINLVYHLYFSYAPNVDVSILAKHNEPG